MSIITFGLLILSALEERSMWCERPYTITAFDLDYTRVDFCGRFYINQVDTEARQITFTQILENGKAQTRVDLPFIAVDSDLKSLLEEYPNFYGSDLNETLSVLKNSEIEFAALIVKEDVVFDIYLLPSGRAIEMGRGRARLFGYDNTQIDVKGFNIVTLKKGKFKRTRN